ncbi:MAG: hypothetical protein ABWY71_03250 [Candidatus Saccharimonadales bacterium]
MNKTLRVVLIWGLLLSPVWLGLIISRVQPYWHGDPAMMFRQAVGVAGIGVIGLAVSLLTRKKDNADKLSVIGYAVPALLVCGGQLWAAFR